MLSLFVALIAVVILVAVGGFLLTYAFFSRPWAQNISYISLPPHAIAEVVKALELKVSSVLFDLGCGDGRVLAAALASNPKIRCIGVEHNPLVRIMAKRRMRRIPLSRVEFRGGNLLNADLTGATHLFTYLNNETMAKLEPRLVSLKPGTRLVSCDFPLPTKAPSKTVKIGRGRQLGQTLYVYEF